MLTYSFTPFPNLKTERLMLRRVIRETDAENILALRSDPRVMKYIGRQPMQQIGEAYNFISLLEEGLEKEDAVNWIITRKGSDELIGNICLWHISREHHRGELGYALLPDHWRQGILTEAATAVLDYGFNIMNLHSIEAVTHPDNAASISSLKKLGFEQEGHFKENFYFNGKFEDSVVFSLLQRNYHPLKI